MLQEGGSRESYMNELKGYILPYSLFKSLHKTRFKKRMWKKIEKLKHHLLSGNDNENNTCTINQSSYG